VGVVHVPTVYGQKIVSQQNPRIKIKKHAVVLFISKQASSRSWWESNKSIQKETCGPPWYVFMILSWSRAIFYRVMATINLGRGMRKDVFLNSCHVRKQLSWMNPAYTFSWQSPMQIRAVVLQVVVEAKLWILKLQQSHSNTSMLLSRFVFCWTIGLSIS